MQYEIFRVVFAVMKATGIHVYPCVIIAGVMKIGPRPCQVLRCSMTHIYFGANLNQILKDSNMFLLIIEEHPSF